MSRARPRAAAVARADAEVVGRARARLLDPLREGGSLLWPDRQREAAAWEALAVIVDAVEGARPDPLVVIGASIPWPVWDDGGQAAAALAERLRARGATRWAPDTRASSSASEASRPTAAGEPRPPARPPNGRPTRRLALFLAGGAR